MADTKITALAAIATVDPAADVLPIVDISDTSMAASGTTKKVTSNQILGAGGTATLASATITGDLTVDTSTLKVDSANDAVGIGTTSPTTYGAKLAVFGSGNGILAVGNATSYTTLQSNGNDFYLNMKGVGSTIFRLGSGDTESMRLNPTGNVVLKGGTIGADGVGVTFPAAQIVSSDANCLDDDEEGTWTGTLAGGTTNPTIPVTATGRYTKVGRQVSVQIAFETVSNVGASGSISITGLPFANAALRVIGAAGAFTGATFSGTLISQIESAASSILFYGVISNSAWTAATHNPVAGAFFWANLTYTV